SDVPEAAEENATAQLAHPSLPLQEYEEICRFCGGEAVVDDSGKALVDVVNPEKIYQGLQEHLLHRTLAKEDGAWRRLTRSLSQGVEKLTGLLARLPQQAPDISAGTEMMCSLLRLIDPRLRT